MAGHIALDLANTVAGRRPGGRTTSRVHVPGPDRLRDYGAVLAWGAAMSDAADGIAPMLAPVEVETLARLAKRAPARAAEALDTLKYLREAVFATFSAIARAKAPPPDALAVLRDAWLEAATAGCLGPAAGGFTLGWTTTGSALELPRHRAAWAAMELLTAGDHTRLAG